AAARYAASRSASRIGCQSVCWPAAAVSTGSAATAAVCWQAVQMPMSPPSGAGTTRTAGASRHCSQRCPGRGAGAGETCTSRISAMRRGRRWRVWGVPAPGSSSGLPLILRWIILLRPLARWLLGPWCGGAETSHTHGLALRPLVLASSKLDAFLGADPLGVQRVLDFPHLGDKV